jgi:glucose-6-phosphate isomerase
MKYIEYEKFLPLQTENFYKVYQEEIIKIHETLHSANTSMTGWVEFPREVKKAALISEIKIAAKKINDESSAMVVVGIGGSNLGTQAVHQMLKKHCNKTRLLYAGCNLSGHYHDDLLKRLDREEDVSICVISKSGTTFEVMLAFKILKKYMKDRYGNQYRERIYVVTDPENGELRKEAKENGYISFAIPPEIGGRYSVHTAVGLLPMAVAGLDIDAFIAGAETACNELSTISLKDNPCYQYALLSFLCNREFKKTLEIFSVTEKKFTIFTKWLVQLFGESEGKDGKGIFPSTALYSTDFHSLGQFLAAGNQIYFESNFYLVNSTISVDNQDIAEAYANLNNYVHETVVRVRKNSNVPLFSFGLKELNEAMVGYLFYFFEKACAVRCYLQKVNPFDQNDVELYKKEMRILCK